MIEHQVYFTKQEAAHYLRCSTRYLDYLRARHELTALRLNRKKLLFTRADLDAVAQKRTQQHDQSL